MAIVWAEGIGASLYKGISAQRVYDEITGIGDRATPKQIVDRARDKTSELHKCFEWDDSKAAERWRLEQARQVRHFLVIKKPEDNPDVPEIRAFHYTGVSDGYVTAKRAFTVADEYAGLLVRAKCELKAFAEKYRILKDDIGEILELIDRL